MIMCHAPGLSAYNPLEHAWTVLASALTGVTLANHLPGESPPEDQCLSKNELCRKEAIVFDLAVDKLCGYWNIKTCDGHPVHAHKVRCLEPEEKYNNNSLLEEYVKASEQKVRESDQLKEIASCTSSYATMLFG